MPERMKEAIALYTEHHDYAKHYLKGAFEQLSVDELFDEQLYMSDLLALHAYNMIVIDTEPVMIPVYAMICKRILDALCETMEKEINR